MKTGFVEEFLVSGFVVIRTLKFLYVIAIIVLLSAGVVLMGMSGWSTGDTACLPAYSHPWYSGRQRCSTMIDIQTSELDKNF